MESTRELFLEMVGEAEAELGHRPSPVASGYLVDLLDTRVRAAAPSGAQDAPETLAESLVEAMLVEGPTRSARLRALGDRALFDAGFFGESLRRKVVGVDYYAQIGTTAYLRVSSWTGSDLFAELGERFTDFLEVLADVGERARGSRSVDLLRLYDRFQETGSARDHARLIRHGMIVPPHGEKDRLQ